MAEKKVLVVDDDALIRKLVEHVLRREGFEVETARDGAEAIARLERGGFDGLVLDLMMPAISGFRLLEILNDDPSIAPPWKIVMTAASNKAIEAIDPSTVDCIVSKPFDIDELRSRVLQCAHRKDEAG